MLPRLLPFFFLFSLSTLSGQALKKHLWKDRVILIFDQHFETKQYQEQLQLFFDEADAIQDRDLVLYRFSAKKALAPNGLPLSPEEEQALRRRYALKTGNFQFILIGKDGGVKLQSYEVVKMEKLFSLIDGMPMRRAEMRRKKNG